MQGKTRKHVWTRKETEESTIPTTCLKSSIYADETHIKATCLVALTALSRKKNDVWYMCGNKE